MADEYKKPIKDKYVDKKNYNTDKKISDNYKNESNLEKEVNEPAMPFYERIENPSYAPVKKYSLFTSILGLLLAASGFATGMYPLAYAGAALGISSLGYYSGHRFRQTTTDVLYRKVKGLEAKVLEPYKDRTLYENRFKPIDLQSYSLSPLGFSGGRSVSDNPNRRLTWEKNFRRRPTGSQLGVYGLILGAIGSFLGVAGYAHNAAYGLPVIYSAGPLLMASIAHMIGYKLGDKRAKPEYKEVKGLEDKLATLPRRKPDNPENFPSYLIGSSLIADYQLKIPLSKKSQKLMNKMEQFCKDKLKQGCNEGEIIKPGKKQGWSKKHIRDVLKGLK